MPLCVSGGARDLTPAARGDADCVTRVCLSLSLSLAARGLSAGAWGHAAAHGYVRRIVRMDNGLTMSLLCALFPPFAVQALYLAQGLFAFL